MNSDLFAQIGVSATTGCAPLVVNFSAPPGATSCNWNFGTAGNSTSLTPQVAFTTPGTYNVTYSGVGGSPTSSTIPITVLANNVNPNINFNIPASHCAPMTVSFTANSTGGTQYAWVFGDAGGGTGANIDYAYTVAGVFVVTLTVTDPATSCVGTQTAGPITVSSPANVFITALPSLNSCTVPYTPAFSASMSTSGSPLTPALTYSWNFGSVAPGSTQMTPGNITNNNPGFYNVTLSVTDDNNCTTSTTEVITLVQPTLAVTVPGTVCIIGQQPYSPPIFSVSAQSNQPNLVWQMGDGNTITRPAGTTFTYQLYGTPGLKTLTVTATIGNCVATVTTTIFVEEITPQFTFTPVSYTCAPSMVATYINQSTVNTSSSLTYTWMAMHWNNNPANSATSTATNPTFTLTQGSANPYTYYTVYKPAAILRITSSFGCISGITHVYDSIRRPTAWFNKDKRQGCAPLTVRFRDSSATNSAIYPIQTYTWNNGANPPTLVTGSIPPPIQQPTFTYNSPGTYTPYLVITTAGGCVDTSFVDTIIVVDPPLVGLTFTPNLSVCAEQPVQINMFAAPASSVIQHWHAQSDDGYFSGCVSNPDPIWPFTHVGVHGFTISAYNHGCASTVVATQTIEVKGPVAKGRFRTNCINRQNVEFFSHLQSADSGTLTFGDGSNDHIIVGNPTGTVADSIVHTYGATGTYTAWLTGVNSATGCGPSTHSMVVNVKNATALFSVDPVVCGNGVITFSGVASVDVDSSCNRGWAWYIDAHPPMQTGNATFFDTINYAPGSHLATLWVRDLNGCTDTVTHRFIVDTPQPSFTIAANPACIGNMPLQFVNTTPQVPVATNTFSWDFGASPSSTTNTFPVSDWPTYNYTAAIPSQTYLVTMWAFSDLAGCVEKYSKVIQINHPPNVDLYALKQTTCINDNLPFFTYIYPEVPGVFTHSVNFGDGVSATTTGTTYAHSYSVAGTYTASVILQDPVGCQSTNTIQVEVQEPPNPEFIFWPASDTTNIGQAFYCNPANVTFSALASQTVPLVYSWAGVVGGPTASLRKAAGYFTNSGVQTVSLTVTTIPGGCSATAVHTIVVLSPTANVVLSDNSICLGDEIKLSIIDSSQVMGWQWVYSNGAGTDTTFALNGPNSPTVSYTFPSFPGPFGQAQVTLVYFGAGRKCPKSVNVGLQVTQVKADFKRNTELGIPDSVHCLNLPDLFTNTSLRNNSTFINNLYFNWNFGNGVTSTSMNPGYTYPTAGVYQVSLTVIDPLVGCTDNTVKNMTINPLPTVSIATPDSVCWGRTFILSSTTSSDVSQYQWMPPNGLVTPNMASTSATAAISTSYSLQVTSVHGCTAQSAAQYMYVQQQPLLIQWDTTIIVGQTTNINANIGPFYTYTWSPLTDLSCQFCTYATSTTTSNITYSVEIEDMMGCFRIVNTYSVFVDPQTSVDVPTAFTPNGDGVNDVIYVDGWGIKRLNYFRIFNRWGQLLFESNDIKIGWDGTYKGVPQNMETYVYQVSVDTYVEGKSLERTSTFRLIR